MIDRKHIGMTLPPFTAVAGAGQLRFFAKAIGETDPVYTDEAAARASGDHNAVHIDLDFARRAGMPDVFAHGMLSMAWLGRLLTRWVDQRQLRGFGVRFVGVTQLGHRITCTGRVVEKFDADGERRLRLEIGTANQYGESRVVGDAVIAL